MPPPGTIILPSNYNDLCKNCGPCLTVPCRVMLQTNYHGNQRFTENNGKSVRHGMQHGSATFRSNRRVEKRHGVGFALTCFGEVNSDFGRQGPTAIGGRTICRGRSGKFS
ncbi:hypothetical protein F6Y31_01265 [Brucella abortus]|nr:hypothetical protein F6Y31_01265 [Brucella abortus]